MKVLANRVSYQEGKFQGTFRENPAYDGLWYPRIGRRSLLWYPEKTSILKETESKQNDFFR